MKRSIGAILIVGLLGMSIIVAVIIRDLKHKSWIEYTPGEIDRLAVGVEAFREEQGQYPEKLSDLQTVSGLHDKEYLKQLLAEKSGNLYQYRVLSDGFVISATRSAELFSKRETMEKVFEHGVTPGGDGKTITVMDSGATNGLPRRR